MDGFDDALDKMALAVESAKVAKSMVVKIDGIGEEINLNLLIWRDDELVAVAQLLSEFMEDKEDRFLRVVNAVCIFRQGWGATAVTMIAEAYCSSDPSASKGKEMAELFASPENAYIRECLSFTHIDGEDAFFLAVPFVCVPPRQVVYGEALRHRGSGVIRDTRYPLGIMRALALAVERYDEGVDEEYFRDLLARGVMDLGFEVNYK